MLSSRASGSATTIAPRDAGCAAGPPASPIARRRGPCHSTSSRRAGRPSAKAVWVAKIAVTGGSGKAGRVVVRDLFEHGHEVLNIDRVPSPESSPPGVADSVPARRRDRLRPDARGAERRRDAARDRGGRASRGDSVAGSRHSRSGLSHERDQHAPVFAAAARLGLRRVVWASSETTLGLPFERPPGLRAGRRGPRLPGDELRAVEGARRGDGAPVQPLERAADRRPAVLEHHGPRRLRAVPRRSGTIRTCANGTCGATSTRAT